MKKNLHPACLWIMAGGAIGAGLRYGLLLLSPGGVTHAPLTIMFENVTGAFLLGILTGFVLSKKIKEWPWLHFIGTGILGSFTTFSAFAIDIVYLIENDFFMGLSYTIFSILFGLMAAFTGLIIGKGKRND